MNRIQYIRNRKPRNGSENIEIGFAYMHKLHKWSLIDNKERDMGFAGCLNMGNF